MRASTACAGQTAAASLHILSAIGAKSPHPERPKVHPFRPSLAHAGRVWPTHGHARAEKCQDPTSIGRVWINFAENPARLARTGHLPSSNLAQVWPLSADNRPNLAQNWSVLTICCRWSNLTTKLWPSSAQFGPESARLWHFGPESAENGQPRAHAAARNPHEPQRDQAAQGGTSDGVGGPAKPVWLTEMSPKPSFVCGSNQNASLRMCRPRN